jgi:hypothetical protein
VQSGPESCTRCSNLSSSKFPGILGGFLVADWLQSKKGDGRGSMLVDEIFQKSTKLKVLMYVALIYLVKREFIDEN